MSIRKSSAQTAINRGTAAAAVATVNQITIAPATATSVAGGGLLGGVTISNVAITDATFATVLSGDTAVSSAGGFVRVTGSGFRTGANVFLNNVLCSNSFVSSTQINATIPASANGTYTFAVFNTDGTGGVWVPGLAVSGPPAWTQASYTSNTLALSIQLLASGDTPLTYYIQPGSSNPQNLAVSGTGLLTGTVSADGSYSITVIVDDAQGQSVQATVSIAVTTTDPYFNLTTLALPADTGANVWIADASTNKFNLTVNGDTRPTKFSPYWTRWSIYANGSSTITNPAGLQTAFAGWGGRTRTFEAWIYRGNTTTYTIQNAYAAVAANGRWYIVINSSNQLVFGWTTSTGSQTEVVSTATVPSEWAHIAVCVNSLTSSSTTIYLCINGTVQTFTNNDLSTQGSTYGWNALFAGASFLPAGFVGYATGIRWSDNLRYTANYTVPTAPFVNDANTLYLIGQDNRFIDRSSNGYSVTVASGTPQVSTFAPFSESDQNIGSGYFDGTGDYLNGINNQTALQFGTGDFTVECWVYATGSTTYSGERGFLQISTASGGLSTTYTSGIFLAFRSTNGIYFSTDGGTSSGVIGGTTALNGWYHVVMVRESGFIKGYVNGQATSVNYSQPANLTANNLVIGGYFNTSYLLEGYIADLRIVKGVAVYTGNFTPPTAPLASSGAASAASYPSTTNVNITFAASSCSLLTLQYPLGENNHRFVDESSNRFLITRNGNATQGTFTPFSQTGWGNYFDGSANGFINVLDASSVLDLPGDFTLEFWSYQNALATLNGTLNLMVSVDTLDRFQIYQDGTNLGFLINGSFVINTTTRPSLNAWNHLAFVRSGTTVTFSNFRLIKGTALYTTNFTPSTTPLTAISGTSLLTCQSNRFIDASSNALSISPIGSTAAVQAFGPFAPTAAYSVATVGGSGYFDGTGDFLSMSDNASFNIGANAFAIELWYYAQATAAERRFISQWDTGNKGIILTTENQTPRFYYSLDGTSDNSITSSATPAINQWNHLAVCRSGSTLSMFLNSARVATTTQSGTFFNATGGITIGSGISGATPMNGYIAAMRSVIGSSPYDATQTSITAPTAPPTAVANTTLLLNFTNAGITDATGKNVFEADGDARVSLIQSRFGGSSMFFDGTGDRLLSPNNPWFRFELDFTVEAWVYPTARGTYPMICKCAVDGNWTVGWAFCFGFQSTEDKLQFWINGSLILQSTNAVALNTWHHVAVSRSGTNLRMFVNGSQEASATNTTSIVPTSVLTVGSDITAANYNFIGYIDDLRITKGFARYTANFTPPTETFRLR